MNAAVFYIYILFRLNGIPCYVGKGKGNRWVRHQGRSKHVNKHLGSIIDQAKAIGKELPKVKVAENLIEESAFELERLLIGLLGRGQNGPLVNLTDGGDGVSGYVPSKEMVEKLAAQRRGKKQSPESNALRSATLKGKPKSPKHVAAASAAQIGSTKSSGWWSTEEGLAKQRANNRGHTGHVHSEEASLKIKQARLQQEARIAVKTSSNWAIRNSVRYPLAA